VAALLVVHVMENAATETALANGSTHTVTANYSPDIQLT